MKHRMAIAVLSLAGLFLSLYLSLWKLGLAGPLVCGVGSCEIVQTSKYAYFLGVPVVFLGVAGYLGLLAVSLVGLAEVWLGKSRPTKVLAVMAGLGVVFSGYLTFIEAFVLEAWCRWCVASAIIMVLIFMVALLGFREKLPMVEPKNG